MNPPRESEMQDGSTQMGSFCQLGEVTKEEFKRWIYHLGARFQWWTSSSEALEDNHKGRSGTL